MPRYRVAICHEESIVIDIDAEDAGQAEELAYDLADEYDVSAERIRQIESGALKKLKAFMVTAA